MTAQVQTRMTAAEFYELPESDQIVELIDGEVIVSPTPLPPHQDTLLELVFMLKTDYKTGKFYVSPLDVYLDDATVIQPAIFWVAPISRCVVTGKRVSGAPDLVIELLSPSTAKRDKTVKFALYEQFGVREYWIVAHKEQFVEVYHLTAGKFVLQGVYVSGETFVSSVLGDKAVDLSTVFNN